MEKPKVSVIVPVYNSEKYLNRCVESLIHQTLQEVEIILVNDGSKDGSGEICRKFAQEDSRIVYIEQKNTGVSAARNRGLDVASGEFVMFCDSDDYYEESAAEKLLKLAQNHQADWVLGAVRKDIKGKIEIAFPGEFAVENQQERAKTIVKLTENFMIYQLWGKLYRREIIEANQLRMRMEMSCGEDHEWICRFVQHTACFSSTNDVAYHYIVENEDSLSQRFNLLHFYNIEKEYQAEKNLLISVGAWEKYGNTVRQQQVQSILRGYIKVRSPKCSLKSRQEIIAYIRSGIELSSAEECRAHPECCPNVLKRMLLQVKNPYIIYLVVSILGSLRRS